MDPDDSALWYLVAGTRGGPTRLQMMLELLKRPYNANQLAERLSLDYKTVRRHLEVLLENGLITASKEMKYGELYHLSDYARSKVRIFESILKKLREEDSGK
ncbi:MAG TPA: winged helix-turn-helix domain-containing protein [Candidatus Bilamarchaeum sp.]|nr:winged helix-turn-helix domain-containing protein [Candidatus Bilamarchaeum sp.]